MDNFKVINFMVKENLSLKMVMYMTDNGKMIKSTEKEK
jgi:hypothetical protein